ncbi:hypothetical protein HA402_004922 [Bradysia odoriphaga]|nr:hypothetical protein HA402_004922 [Bradysia odoriphaga]
MEIPVQVAYRFGPSCCSNKQNFELTIPGLQLPRDCTQDYVYYHTVYPLLAIYLEGFDVSFVTYGQKSTGKSYTMIGPGLDCVFDERDQGIIQRCVRDIFVKMGQQSERDFVIRIEWCEIVGDEIHNLLDVGTVQCSSIGDVFAWLKIGMDRRTAENHFGHSLFTITLEQKWISAEGLIQHRLSTASFCDLCATERMLVMDSMEQHISVPRDLGLQALERIVHDLNDPNCLTVDYNQTILTSFLKDSFGGRAQTLLIMCVSPCEEHFTETQHNLQFAYKVQCIRNFVVLGTFADNNTVAQVPVVPNEIAEQPDNFGLQFAASQWLKLVSNAEGLFTKLITTESLNEQDRERIAEWIFLKQECEECLSSGEINMENQRHLGPIQEEVDEQEETSDQETSCAANTDLESDSESQHPDLNEKMAGLMEEFQYKTDELVRNNHNEFILSHPKAMLDSSDSFRKMQESHVANDNNRSPSPIYDRRQSAARCERRKSYQPDGLSVSSMELAMLNRVASEVASRKENVADGFLSPTADAEPTTKHSQLHAIQSKLRTVNADLEAYQRQIKELKNTIALRKTLIADYSKTTEARATVRQRLKKERAKRQAEYNKCNKNIQEADIDTNIDGLELKKKQLKLRMKNLNDTIGLTDENIEQHKKSLKMSQKQLDELNDSVKRNKKLKDSLENKLKMEKSKINKERHVPSTDKHNVKNVDSRITHMNHVIKKKSNDLQLFDDRKDGEALRQEIRNLRGIRDHVLKEKKSLVQKLKKDKTLTLVEERKLLEYEESVEAIDHIVEYKNELICGRKSAETDDSLQLERGQQMLVDKWNTLPAEEMRTLLYKYFQKAVDLRDSTSKLEQQLMALERERDAWECRERALNNAIRQARLEGESHAVLLQQQQEAKVALMLRHMADETSTNSSLADRYAGHHQSNHHGIPDDSANGCLGLDIYKPSMHHKQMIKSKAPNMDMELYPISDGHHRYKYRPLDKMNEKNREGKKHFFTKIFAHYGSGFGVDRRKVQDLSMSIPEQNLKQLQASQEPMTKVTREKNKIIIQQDGRHSGHRH